MTRAAAAELYRWMLFMSNSFKFISGGGWLMHTAIARPITHWLTLFSIVSSVISAVTVGACVVMRPAISTSWTEIVSFPFYLLILPSPILIILAIIGRLIEQPREITVRQRNPNYDPHNLY